MSPESSTSSHTIALVLYLQCCHEIRAQRDLEQAKVGQGTDKIENPLTTGKPTPEIEQLTCDEAVLKFLQLHG
jgi:hypothetical protein